MAHIRFYNDIDNSKTLLGNILQAIPDWSIGIIDPMLWNKHRTFDVPESKVYGFLMTDIETAYECIFTFDTENKKINAFHSPNIVKQSNIMLTFNNLLNDVTITEENQDIVTCLGVYGSSDFDIRDVNPLGTSMMYNYSYYKNTEWMEESLVNSLDIWEQKVLSQSVTYKSLLNSLKVKNK